MKLYFFRHGEAEEGTTVNDFNRQLTVNGSARVKTAGRVLAKLGIKPTHLFSSPRVRAKQTAELLSKALNIPVEEREELNFHFDVTNLEGLIDALDDPRRCAIASSPTRCTRLAHHAESL
jgi:phosphohistidine phosphatase